MRLGFVLFNWFPHGGLQQDLVKIVRACQPHADIVIHCLEWDGPRLEGVETCVVGYKRFTRNGCRDVLAAHVQEVVKPAVDVVVGFNRMPGLDYYFAADSCFAHRANQKGWWYRLAPRTRQYLQFEEAVFGKDSSTVALLLSPLQRAQYSQHYQTPPQRLIDLPPGIDRKHRAGEDAAALRASFRQQFRMNDDDLVVLQIGSSFGTKGVDRSLMALAALPPAVKQRVHYCLMGKDKHKARWRQRAEQTGLQNRIHFLDSAEHSVPRCMQGADVLLHPSLHESAGMVILEGVVAGLPVLTTASCGYASYVETADAGLVCAEPFEQNELNALLLTMLTTERGGWRANGIRYGEQHNLYDMPAVVADIVLKRRK
jgi:UDP-glucose:(heptosyl)LPS alpha-1,3-glucosyltransferase